MKTFGVILFTLLLSPLAFSAPLAGYSTMRPFFYQIVNAKKETIYRVQADFVRRVELRDGFAVVQTMMNQVSLILENKKTVIDRVYGEQIGISKTLLSLYNQEGNGMVYRLDGTKVFPAKGEAQRAVKGIWISNERFAVLDRFTRLLTVYDLDGKALFTSMDAEKVLLSDGFLVTVSDTGNLSLYDETLDLITTDNQTSKIQISDEFASYFDRNGNLRLFSRKKGEFAPFVKPTFVSLTNSFALIQDPQTLTLFGKDGRILENQTRFENFQTSHQLFAYQQGGSVWVQNLETGKSMVVPRAISYLMTDDALLIQNAPGNYSVYSLNPASFGTYVYGHLDPTVVASQLGNGTVSFETTMRSSPLNRGQVITFSGDAMKSSVLVDESWVTKVDLTVNREEWNWQ